MELLAAEPWRLVDRRSAGEPEVELLERLERPSGTLRRRTRVVTCPDERAFGPRTTIAGLVLCAVLLA